jgi:hypothetical protein
MLRAHKDRTLAIKLRPSRSIKRRRASRVEDPLLRGSTQPTYPERKVHRLEDLLLFYVACFSQQPVVDCYRRIKPSHPMAARKSWQRKREQPYQIREVQRNPILDRSIPVTVILIRYSSFYWATKSSVRYGFAPEGSLFTSTSLGASS